MPIETICFDSLTNCFERDGNVISYNKLRLTAEWVVVMDWVATGLRVTLLLGDRIGCHTRLAERNSTSLEHL